MRMTLEQFAAHQSRTGGIKPGVQASLLDASRRRDQKPSPLAAMRAKGRMKTGEMNGTEAAYAAHLEARKQAGEVLWYEFEAIKLKLSDNTHLTVDFSLMLADGTLELHDVKGSKAIYQDDAKVKMKWAAQRYPFVFRVAFPKKKKDGGGWDIEEV